MFEWKWALYLSLFIGLVSLASARVMFWITKVWMMLGTLLGHFVPNVLLTIVYFVILVPLALITQILNRSSLFKLKPNSHTQYVTRDHTFTRDDFERPW